MTTRAIVVGICHNLQNISDAAGGVHDLCTGDHICAAPKERKLLSFVLVKAKPGVSQEDLCKRITDSTKLLALTREQMKLRRFWYFMKNTGIPINFGIAVVLGFFVGTAIAGLTFYKFTLDNLRFFGALKAMGASNFTLLRMILLQSSLVGAIGYGLGVGLAAFMGYATRNTELAFRMPWQLLVITGSAVIIICAASAMLSMYKCSGSSRRSCSSRNCFSATCPT